MVIPFFHYMLKEITTKCAFAYTDQDFKETVDAFLAGGLYQRWQSTWTNNVTRQIRK